MTTLPEEPAARKNIKRLYLDFECLRSIPEGINEVHVWWDPYLKVERVGKTVDISGLEGDDSLPEPSTLQEIKHPNIVEVITASHMPQYPEPMHVVELITPYHRRGSITDALLRHERFKLTEAIRVCQAALHGVAELHDVFGILHRDIKSGNILLAEDSTVAKVADLGLATRLDQDGLAVAANNPTLYAPPEFMSGALGVTSDIYSMGLVLHELIAGPFPYAEYSKSDVLEHLNQGIGAARTEDLSLPVYTPKSLRRVIAKATDKNSNKRYQSAREMNQALANVTAVDWAQTEEMRWEAPFLHNPRVRVSVEGKKKKDNSYMVTVRTLKRVWRKSMSEERVPDMSAASLCGIFDKATAAACTR